MSSRHHPARRLLQPVYRLLWRSSLLSSGLLAFVRTHLIAPILEAAGLSLGSATVGSTSWLLPSIAGLGAYETLSGATTITFSPSLTNNTLTIDQGQSLLLACVINSTAHGTAKSYSISGTVPPGVTPLTGAVVNGNSVSFTGTPSSPGSYQVRVKGWENPSAKGESSPTYMFTLQVLATVVPPSIVTQPAPVTANWGGSALFSVVVKDATSLRWRRNGVPLTDRATVSGATSSTLVLSDLTSADDGALFDLVATGQNALTTTSQAASLEVATDDFALWRETTFSGAERFDDAVSGPFANLDHDLRDNLLEFALNSDPRSADPAQPYTSELLPDNTTPALRITFAANPAMVETQLLVETAASPDATAWDVVSTIDKSAGNIWSATVALDRAATFIRLRAQ